MGGLIWLTTNGIEAQINRPGVFGNNSYTGRPGGGELGYGCGKLTIDLGENAFPKTNTHQHLGLYDAVATYESPGLVVHNLAWSNGDVMAFHMKTRESFPSPWWCDCRR